LRELSAMTPCFVQRAQTHICPGARAHTNEHIHKYVHANTHAHKQARTQTGTHANTHAYKHARTRNARARARAFTRRRAQARAHAHGLIAKLFVPAFMGLLLSVFQRYSGCAKAAGESEGPMLLSSALPSWVLLTAFGYSPIRVPTPVSPRGYFSRRLGPAASCPLGRDACGL